MVRVVEKSRPLCRRRRSDAGVGKPAVQQARRPRAGRGSIAAACRPYRTNCTPPLRLPATARYCFPMSRSRSMTMRAFERRRDRSLSGRRPAGGRHDQRRRLSARRARRASVRSHRGRSFHRFSACRCCRCLRIPARRAGCSGDGIWKRRSDADTRTDRLDRDGKIHHRKTVRGGGRAGVRRRCAVHKIYEGEAAPAIEAAFPGTTVDGKVDRAKLSAKVVHDPPRSSSSSRSFIPMLGASARKFLDEAERAGAPVVVLDIPLLFETGGEKRVDAVVVVSTRRRLQRERVLARGTMTSEALDAHSGAANARCRKAQARGFRGGYVAWIGPGRARRSATFWPRSLRCRSGEPDSPYRWRQESMREIVLDTETTGLDPLRGDRLVEIGCIEIFNRMPTGQTFHRYINPERDMPAEAFAVHGLSAEFLQGQAAVRRSGRGVPGIHRRRAAGHPQRLVRPRLHQCRAGARQAAADFARALVDTLLLARRKHPGVSNRLDDLCSRYAIDNSRRTKHGALLDAELLAEVYIDLIGARQAQLILASETRVRSATDLAKRRAGSAAGRWRRGSPRPTARRIAPSSPPWATSRSGAIFFEGGRRRLAAGLP